MAHGGDNVYRSGAWRRGSNEMVIMAYARVAGRNEAIVKNDRMMKLSA